MRLAAAIAALTGAGALGGAIARPSRRVAPQVALVLGVAEDAGMQLYPQGTAWPAAPGVPRAAMAPTLTSASAIPFPIQRKIQERLREPALTGGGTGRASATSTRGWSGSA